MVEARQTTQPTQHGGFLWVWVSPSVGVMRYAADGNFYWMADTLAKSMNCIFPSATWTSSDPDYHRSVQVFFEKKWLTYYFTCN